jgi:surfactin synthase thioesterase subunit
VCLPHAGGSSSFFFPVSKSLSPAVEVLAVQYPGRQDRHTEATIDTVPELVEEIFAALRPIAGQPFSLFGHSMGATVAYELALRIQDAHLPAPLHLFASGRRAPSRYRDENVHQRTDDEIVAEMTLLSGEDAPFLADADVLRMSMPAIRADYRAIETYRHAPGRVLSCPVTVLTGDSDPRVSLEEARAWSEHTSGLADVRIFPGGHFFLVEHSADVLRLIRQTLAGK